MLLGMLPTNGRLTADARWPEKVGRGLRQQWRNLVERCAADVVAPARAAGTAPPPEAERVSFERYGALIGEVLRIFVPELRDMAWENARSIRQALDALALAATPTRGASIQAVGSSFEEYLVQFESAARLMAPLQPPELQALADGAGPAAGRAAADRESCEAWVLRWQVTLLVALDCVRTEAPDTELGDWAWRARSDALHARAALAAQPDWLGDLRRALLHRRARAAWAEWDATEIQRETEPWPVHPA